MAQVEANAQQLQTREHREGQRSPVVLAELKKRADDWQLHRRSDHRVRGFHDVRLGARGDLCVLGRVCSSALTATRSSS